MSGPDLDRPDPRQRPDDPAGTKPKVDSASLLPAVREPLITTPVVADAIEDEHVELDAVLPPPVEAPHTPRFQFLLGALFALGIAAVAAIALLIAEGTPDRADEPAWSAWKPTTENPTAEIAQFVAERYTHEGGKQLVNVTGGPLQFNGTPLELVLDTGVNYFPIGGTGVLYNLCGIGSKDCRIPHGKPSLERAQLLRREVVELALYTFRYTDADNVVATLPLTANKDGKFRKRQSDAVLLQRADVEPVLERPLATTLVPEPPSVGTVSTFPDSVFVDSLLRERSFRFRLQSAGLDGGYMVLRPPPAPTG